MYHRAALLALKPPTFLSVRTKDNSLSLSFLVFLFFFFFFYIRDYALFLLSSSHGVVKHFGFCFRFSFLFSPLSFLFLEEYKTKQDEKLIHIQLNPALTDFRGLAVFLCYRQTSVIANKGNKRN